ncbi:transcription factor BIM2-like isoform X2 [Tripterygium wilfordii]|uniref:transcription factor BIM2-like isoform X2 n=1 Tax=Tripterygium wilfordii TaxID=458696 RepID=UPI0018F80EA2|nr:transcription factor BIM2-like isoform X2 [Tripterygium wilfordii]
MMTKSSPSEKMDLLPILLQLLTALTRPKADAKNSDKSNAFRSKHSVTEQRRRSKINERFQILRDLIPYSDQKRDTASFLLEVIQYVQYLQEKVQKYEGSNTGYPEPTKLMPWRNSRWHNPSFVGHPQAIKNSPGPGSEYPVKFDKNNVTVTPNMVDGDPSKAIDRQSELANKGVPLPLALQGNMPAVRSAGVLAHPPYSLVSDTESKECPLRGGMLTQQDELTIEGGTIRISSVYSQGLFEALTQALHSTGVDLSRANISVQIDLGKRANGGLSSGTSAAKDPHNPTSSNVAMTHLKDMRSTEDSDQAQKRLKT